MSDLAIRVEGVSKQYRLGPRERYKALRDVATEAMLAPYRMLKGLGAPKAAQTDNQFWALKDVSFEVKRGEVVGVIGRNGAGKSTLLKILSRITEPTKGEADIHGRVGSLLEVGTGFHPELTGRENVYLNGAILGMRRAEIGRKFDEIVAFAEVEKFIDTPVKHYSSGMQMRLAFAVAAHLEPEILLVDEVLAVGDAAFQKKCLGKMGEVSREGRTILFVSHNISAIQQLCAYSFLMHGGQIIESGPTEVVVGRYMTLALDNGDINKDLINLPRGDYSDGRIRFQRCLVIDSENQVSKTLKYGEPFSVFLEAISEVVYEDLTVVVGVDSVMGVRIFTSASSETGKFFTASPTEPLRVEVLFDEFVLVPGMYQLSIGIQSGKLGLDTLLNIVDFEITHALHIGQQPHSGVRGFIDVPGKWSLSID